ncbi:SGNH/GDSL hydrolase family protein [Christiangramia portivictoriae]|uniref:SGNH/GDSL hydrolase family protein n=1 Tax=Christiangramia portivictoriae TaxID=326069 RepID=UPI0004296D83|nr:SGNH/GDSL hydrolase family protein [Christiangramia portivictoriae]
MKYWHFTLFFLILISVGCENIKKKKEYLAGNSKIQYNGRVQKIKDSSVILIGAGSNAQMTVVGDSCLIFLSNEDQRNGYVSIEINNDYKGRYQVNNKPIKLPLGSVDTSNVIIYKATEASTGDVIFNKIIAENLLNTEAEKTPLIEFIGNSITCGMGAQTEEIPCDTAEWYDQHNAYLAYGPRTARRLNLNFRLSCVSGMGMYRNWNDEDQPVMPDVYENLRLNADSTNAADLGRKPDLVSIALGTNDLSLGDGEKERSDFSQEKFVENYIGFVEKIFQYFPETKVTLLTSPMIGENEQGILLESFQKVRDHFTDKPVFVFEFEQMKPNGCGGHPDIKDHKKMADQLTPFLEKVLKNE